MQSEEFRHADILQQSVFILSRVENLESCRYLCIGQTVGQMCRSQGRRLARAAHGTRLVMGELPGTCPVDAIESDQPNVPRYRGSSKLDDLSIASPDLVPGLH